MRDVPMPPRRTAIDPEREERGAVLLAIIRNADRSEELSQVTGLSVTRARLKTWRLGSEERAIAVEAAERIVREDFVLSRVFAALRAFREDGEVKCCRVNTRTRLLLKRVFSDVGEGTVFKWEPSASAVVIRRRPRRR